MPHNLESIVSGLVVLYTAVDNTCVLDWLFKCRCLWWSKVSKDGYIKDSQEAMLSVYTVTKSLKL